MASAKPLKLNSGFTEQFSGTDTVPPANLPVMVGDSGAGGTQGVVPAPAAGDAAAGKFLKADGTWAAGGSGAPTNAQYLTLATDATLSAERVFTAGINIAATDAGAGSTLTVDALAGSQTTSQFTSDQDNFSPTNWSTKTTHYVSSDSSIRAITSFSALSDGVIRRLVNTGTHPIYIPGEHPDGTAANRVITESDCFIGPNGGNIEIYYDSGNSRWRIGSNTFNPSLPGLNGMYGHFYTASVGATITGDWGDLGIAGNVDIDAPTSTRMGSYVLYTSTSSTGTGVLYYSDNILNPTEFALTHSVCSVYLFVDTLSTSSQRYTLQSGFVPSPSSTTLAVNNSVGIRYVDNVNSGKWEGFTRNNSGTESTVDLGTTVAANTAYILTTCIDKAHTEVRFYLNGVYAGRVTTNLPTSGTDYGMRTGIFKSVGTTSSTCHVPWMTFYTIKGI